MITGTLSDRVSALMPQVKTELAELVAMRSVADARQFPPQECRDAAQRVVDKFAGVGFTGLRLAEMVDASMAVYGSRPSKNPNAPTILLYAHDDVQPPIDEKAWRKPPFELTVAPGEIGKMALSEAIFLATLGEKS